MKRTTLIVGIAIWVVICLGWSCFFGPSTMNTDSFGREVRVMYLGSCPIWAYLVGFICVYAICWINIVNEWERRIVMRFGKYVRTLGPGISFVEPIFNHVLDDISIQDDTLEISVEHMQTQDNVGVAIIGMLTYCVDSAKVKESLFNVENVYESLEQRALSTLNDEGGKVNLDRLLTERDKFCDDIKKILAARVSAWGLIIKAFELKAFKITDPAIENAIAMKAKAKKEGEAELERAHIQEQVAIALNKAAETYSEKGHWLKGIETLVEMTRSAQNNTVISPSDLMSTLATSVASKM